MESEFSPCKSDIPWYYRSPFFSGVYYVACASILVGTFVDPTFASGRPGLVNGLLGLILGTLGGKPAGNFLIKDIQKNLPMSGLRWCVPIRGFHINSNQLIFSFLFFTTMFAAIALCDIAIQPLRLSWPWCGSADSVMGGGLVSASIAFVISVGNKVDRWYKCLPD